jgi:hypothetical protein
MSRSGDVQEQDRITSSELLTPPGVETSKDRAQLNYQE